MYWTDSGTNKIQRANLDGSGVEDLITSGLSDPRGLALDLGAGKMYWTDRGTDKIQRANLDGSRVEDLVTSGLSSPSGLALDTSGGGGGGAQPLAPTSQAAFDSLVVGKVLVFEVLTSTPPGAPDEIRVSFPSSGRSRIADTGHSGGTYEFVSTGLNTGTLRIKTSRDTHGGTSAHEHAAITQLTFTTATTGTFTGSIEGILATGTGNFRIINP